MHDKLTLEHTIIIVFLNALMITTKTGVHVIQTFCAANLELLLFIVCEMNHGIRKVFVST